MENQRESDLRREFVDRIYEHQGIVRKVCAVYAGGPDEREDLSQEILAQLWRSYPAFRGDSSFPTWAYRVALNTALLSHRRAASRPRAGRAIEGDDEGPAAPPEPDRAETAEAVQLLYACIRELRDVDRAIVLLHLEEQPHATIAEIAGLEPGNVAVRLHRIKERLRRCLRARGYRSD